MHSDRTTYTIYDIIYEIEKKEDSLSGEKEREVDFWKKFPDATRLHQRFNCLTE